MVAIGDPPAKVQPKVQPIQGDAEDAALQRRLEAEDRTLTKRVDKKFIQYQQSSRENEQRDAFLVELANFNLTYTKYGFAILAQQKQELVYNQTKEQYDAQSELIKNEIDELKAILGQVHESQRRKNAYDEIAVKINTLPARTEFERDILELQAEIQTIKEQHESEDKIIAKRVAGVEELIRQFSGLRRLDKGEDVIFDDELLIKQDNSAGADEIHNLAESIEMEEGEEIEPSSRSERATSRAASTLNPNATVFQPRDGVSKSLRNQLLRSQSGYDLTSGLDVHSPASSTPVTKPDEDIEMGELSEESDFNPAALAGEREEGETDSTPSPTARA